MNKDEERILLAIAEAERWAVAFERPFSKLLDKGGFTENTITLFAKEFQVARTLWWKNARKTTKADKRAFANFINSLQTDQSASLAFQFKELLEQKTMNATAEALWKANIYPSALSKFYMARTDWMFPPFDSYVAKAVNAKGLNNEEKAQNFYSILDKADYVEIADRLAHKTLAFGKLSPARIVDKYMMIKGGIGSELAQAFAYSQADKKEKWASLALDITPLVNELFCQIEGTK